jgi:hypothetical protein
LEKIMPKMRVEGMDEVILGFRKGPRIFKQERKRAYVRVIDHIVPRIQAHTPVDKRTLHDAIEGRLEDNDGTIVIDAGKVPSVIALSVEGGARPHWPPWGPGSALAGWAARKGIPVFLVARAIARRGTIKRFDYGGAEMFRKGFEESEGFINREIGNTKIGVVGAIIRNTLRRLFK